MSRREKCQRESAGLEALEASLDLLIQQTESRTDPILQQLQQCPEAFLVGNAIESMFKERNGEFVRESERILPAAGTVFPFV